MASRRPNDWSPTAPSASEFRRRIRGGVDGCTDLVEETVGLWQPRTTRQLTPENAREIVENITGFFRILGEWAEAETRTQQDYVVENAKAANGGHGDV